jgi:hypothetical protein
MSRTFSLSFFLTTPAKKPRTECCCQSVAFMIAAMVAPFGRRSMASTVACLEERASRGRAGLEVAVLAFDDPPALAGRFAGRGDLAADADFVAGLTFVLLAIWLSLHGRQHHLLPPPQARRIGRAREPWSLSAAISPICAAGNVSVPMDTLTLCRAPKSSDERAIFWLFWRFRDHKVIPRFSRSEGALVLALVVLHRPQPSQGERDRYSFLPSLFIRNW